MSAGFTIVGQGLAGTCVAWRLWRRGVDFTIRDPGRGGASRVAAGLVNPVTGKNFEPSWRIGEFLPEALAFYGELEEALGVKLWHPMPVLRLAGTEKEWRKISAKLEEERVRPWVAGVADAPEKWCGAVELKGGGRLDVRLLVEESRRFFAEQGWVRDGGEGTEIRCEGAAGLMTGRYGPHRSAKGEILTVRAAGWDESVIRVGGGGWLVPLGNGLFKAGANYEWDELDETPTEKGREFVERILEKLGGGDFEIADHEAGVRPILRRSQPLIGPVEGGGWMFNGLGSKGSLYAPGMARRLVEWMVEGLEAEKEVDFREFLER